NRRTPTQGFGETTSPCRDSSLCRRRPPRAASSLNLFTEAIHPGTAHILIVQATSSIFQSAEEVLYQVPTRSPKKTEVGYDDDTSACPAYGHVKDSRSIIRTLACARQASQWGASSVIDAEYNRLGLPPLCTMHGRRRDQLPVDSVKRLRYAREDPTDLRYVIGEKENFAV